MEIVTSHQDLQTGKVSMETMLVDCRATGKFVDRKHVEKQGWVTYPLTQAIPVYNVNGTHNRGDITHYLPMQMSYQGHNELIHFNMVNLRKDKFLLGDSWLRQHNPDIDWAKHVLTLSQCLAKCGYSIPKLRAEACSQIRRTTTLEKEFCDNYTLATGKDWNVRDREDSHQIRRFSPAMDMANRARPHAEPLTEVLGHYKPWSKVFSDKDSECFPPS